MNRRKLESNDVYLLATAEKLLKQLRTIAAVPKLETYCYLQFAVKSGNFVECEPYCPKCADTIITQLIADDYAGIDTYLGRNGRDRLDFDSDLLDEYTPLPASWSQYICGQTEGHVPFCMMCGVYLNISLTGDGQQEIDDFEQYQPQSPHEIYDFCEVMDDCVIPTYKHPRFRVKEYARDTLLQSVLIADRTLIAQKPSHHSPVFITIGFVLSLLIIWLLVS